MSIEIPEEFKKVCRNLVQGLEVTTLRELAQAALFGVESRDLPKIKVFLGELLNGRYSKDQLKDIWWSTPSDIVFSDGEDIVIFLRELRDEVDRVSRAM